jgi:trehalose 6-phosphate synthase/phosphatase
MCLFDYDGTLVPFTASPDAAVPDDELREILRALAARPGVRVHVLSGRKREDLERWLGDLTLGLHAEHGFWSSLSSHSGWQPLRELSTDWKQKIMPILEQFAARTPGSLIEEKTASLAWHYRQADPQFGPRQARELRHYLRETLSNMPVEVIKGEKVIEVRPYGVHKGVAAHRILAEEDGQTILAMGDDRTDEDLFAAIPPQSFSVSVGRSPSIARYSVPDVAAARALLRAIAGI